MTPAILSFTTPGRVMLRCDALAIHDLRDLEPDPPFAAWSRAYAAGAWSAEELLVIGLHIGRWFNGSSQWLARLRQATAPVILTIETRLHPEALEKAVLDAPWELLASAEPDQAAARLDPAPVIDATQPDPLAPLRAQLGPVDFRRVRHLALDPSWALTTMRRLGLEASPRAPSQYRLSVVFMAAQPDGLKRLEVDREEAAIHRAAGGIGIDLAVEDSGNLEGLGDMVARVGDCDVIQLSCHGAGGTRPILALEDKLGKRVDVTANELSNALGVKPRLMFVSACSSAAAVPAPQASESSANALAASVGSDVLWPLSADLCRRGWSAVLGWSGAVSDPAAIDLAGALYRQLAMRLPLAEALGKARVVLANSPSGAAWHKPRLFVGRDGGGQIVHSARPRPDQPDFVRAQEFLDPTTRRIPMATAEVPFPHRRAFQHVMATLRAGDCNGVIVHGGDELSRATFAGRVLRRVDRELARVVVARHFDAPAILQEIRVQTARREVDKIVAAYFPVLFHDPAPLLPALREILQGPCRDAGNGAFALVLHGFDPIVASIAQPSLRRDLAPDMLPVARALITAFAGARTASRLLFTSTVPFSVVDNNGIELADSLCVESLDPR